MMNGRHGRSRLDDWAWGTFGIAEPSVLPEGELATTASLEARDDADAIVVTIDLPGVKEQDIALDLEGGQLHLHATRKITLPDGAMPHRQERRSFDVRRTLALPRTVDGSRADASLENGVLTITLPKMPEAQPRRVPVNASN